MSSFQWAEFLQIAEALAADGETQGSEGWRRTIIGRAYYATFNAARLYAASEHGIAIKASEGSVHGKLWSELSFKSGKVAKLANHGKQLHRLRKHADYDASPEISAAHVREGLTLAKLAAQLLTEFNAPAASTP